MILAISILVLVLALSCVLATQVSEHPAPRTRRRDCQHRQSH